MESIESPRKETERSNKPDQYAGYTLRDPLGQKLGMVESVFVNQGGLPEYVRTKLGGFGSKSVLIPVLNVTHEEERRTLTLEWRQHSPAPRANALGETIPATL